MTQPTLFAATATHHPGHLSGAATGINRRAKLATCPRCRAAVLRCLDGDGLPATADPRPLTPAGELAALVAGRDTYDAWHVANTWVELEHRNHFTLAAPRRWPVLPGHACPGVVPDWSFLPTPPAPRQEDTCPF